MKHKLKLLLLVAIGGIAMFFGTITNYEAVQAKEFRINAREHIIDKDGSEDIKFVFNVGDADEDDKSKVVAPVIEGFHVNSEEPPVETSVGTLTFDYYQNVEEPEKGVSPDENPVPVPDEGNKFEPEDHEKLPDHSVKPVPQRRDDKSDVIPTVHKTSTKKKKTIKKLKKTAKKKKHKNKKFQSKKSKKKNHRRKRHVKNNQKRRHARRKRRRK